MWTFPSAEDSAPCLKLTLDLMDAWVQGGVTPREVAFIERFLVRSYAFEIDTAAKRLHQALDVELLGLPPDYYTSWTERVRGVTAAGASAAVKQRIHTNDILAVVVGTASQILSPIRESMANLAEVSVVPFDVE